MSDARCVLIVDDEEDVRDSLRDVVELAGCSVLLASSASEALRILETHRPCLVIVDLMMPEMNGAELIAALRLDRNHADLAVAISTSAPERAPPGIPLLPKPIDLGAVFELLGSACGCRPVVP